MVFNEKRISSEEKWLMFHIEFLQTTAETFMNFEIIRYRICSRFNATDTRQKSEKNILIIKRIEKFIQVIAIKKVGNFLHLSRFVQESSTGVTRKFPWLIRRAISSTASLSLEW